MIGQAVFFASPEVVRLFISNTSTGASVGAIEYLDDMKINLPFKERKKS